MTRSSQSLLERPDRAALTTAWKTEREAARTARTIGNTPAEWHHLQRAHILSQPIARLHLATHAAMLGAALRRRDGHEVGGQLVRMLLAVPGSVTGRYPLG